MNRKQDCPNTRRETPASEHMRTGFRQLGAKLQTQWEAGLLTPQQYRNLSERFRTAMKEIGTLLEVL